MILPATAAENSPAAPPVDIYVSMRTPVPIVAAPSPAPAPAAAHEEYVEMPSRTHGVSRALRDDSREYAHWHGLPLDHAAIVSMLEKGRTIHEIVRQYGNSPDLPAAHTLDLPTPKNVSDVEKSPHADIWRHSMHQEFNGLLQACSFVPTPA